MWLDMKGFSVYTGIARPFSFCLDIREDVMKRFIQRDVAGQGYLIAKEVLKYGTARYLCQLRYGLVCRPPKKYSRSEEQRGTKRNEDAGS